MRILGGIMILVLISSWALQAQEADYDYIPDTSQTTTIYTGDSYISPNLSNNASFEIPANYSYTPAPATSACPSYNDYLSSGQYIYGPVSESYYNNNITQNPDPGQYLVGTSGVSSGIGPGSYITTTAYTGDAYINPNLSNNASFEIPANYSYTTAPAYPNISSNSGSSYDGIAYAGYTGGQVDLEGGFSLSGGEAANFYSDNININSVPVGAAADTYPQEIGAGSEITFAFPAAAAETNTATGAESLIMERALLANDIKAQDLVGIAASPAADTAGAQLAPADPPDPVDRLLFPNFHLNSPVMSEEDFISVAYLAMESNSRNISTPGDLARAVINQLEADNPDLKFELEYGLSSDGRLSNIKIDIDEPQTLMAWSGEQPAARQVSAGELRDNFMTPDFSLDSSVPGIKPGMVDTIIRDIAAEGKNIKRPNDLSSEIIHRLEEKSGASFTAYQVEDNDGKLRDLILIPERKADFSRPENRLVSPEFQFNSSVPDIDRNAFDRILSTAFENSQNYVNGKELKAALMEQIKSSTTNSFSSLVSYDRDNRIKSINLAGH